MRIEQIDISNRTKSSDSKIIGMNSYLSEGLTKAKDDDVSLQYNNLRDFKTEIDENKREADGIARGKEFKAFLRKYDFLKDNSEKVVNKRVISNESSKSFTPITKSLEESDLIDKLINKNDYNKTLGKLHVKPVSGVPAFDIPFEFNPQISSEQMSSTYTTETLMNKIGNFFVYTGTKLPQINITLDYEALASDNFEESAKENIGKQFSTDIWEYYWSDSKINEIEYKLRSLALPDLTSNEAAIVVPPVVEIIMGSSNNVRDLYKYPNNVGRKTGIGGKYFSVTKSLGDEDIYKKYIVTSIQIEYKNKDISYASYYGKNIEKSYEDSNNFMNHLTDNYYRKTYRRGFKASLQLTEITANFLDVAPDFAAYYNAWNSDLGILHAKDTERKIREWAKDNQTYSGESLQDRKILELNTVEKKINSINERLNMDFTEAAKIAKLFNMFKDGEYTNKFLNGETPFEYMNDDSNYFMIGLPIDYKDENDYSERRNNRLVRMSNGYGDVASYVNNISYNNDGENMYFDALGINNLPIKRQDGKDSNYPDVSCVALEYKISEDIKKFGKNDKLKNIDKFANDLECRKIQEEQFEKNNIKSYEISNLENISDFAFPENKNQLMDKYTILQKEPLKSISGNQNIIYNRIFNGPNEEFSEEIEDFSEFYGKIKSITLEEIREKLNIDIFKCDKKQIDEICDEMIKIIDEEPDFGIIDVFEETEIEIPKNSTNEFLEDNVPLRNLPTVVRNDILEISKRVPDLRAHLKVDNGLLFVDLGYSNAREMFSGDMTLTTKSPEEISNNYDIGKLPVEVVDYIKQLASKTEVTIHMTGLDNGLMQIEVTYMDILNEFSGKENVIVKSIEEIDNSYSLSKLPTDVSNYVKDSIKNSNKASVSLKSTEDGRLEVVVDSNQNADK